MNLPCLDIIIPHYSEKPQVVRHLLDSIEMQVGLNLSKAIKVTIVNDKNDAACVELSAFIDKADYSFPIEILQTNVNGGAGLARQYGLDHTNLPYIMFCDADDSLYSCSALSSLLNQIRLLEVQQKSWNYIWGNFYEEQITKTRGYNLIPHDKLSMIWLHGKIWNRAFLTQYNIRFHSSLRTFEDTYFGKLVALSAPKSTAQHVNEVVYLWRNNPNSVTADWNHDKHSYLYWRNDDYVTCTYSVLKALRPRYKTIERWNETFFVGVMFTYFMLQFGEFNTNEPHTLTLRTNLECLFVALVSEFGDTITRVSNLEKVKWYSMTRYEIVNQFSFNIEQVSWNDFLKYIDEKYKINSYDLLKIDNLTYSE